MNIPKSPSLQLLRRLHHQPLGFNDISITSENDWESESTIIHRHSVSGSSRTSRCSSVLSCALDWEEADKAEISLPTFIDYKTNEKPNWDFTDEMQRFTNKSPSDGAEEGREDDDEEQQDETIMSEGNVDIELPKDDDNDVEDEEVQDENLTPLNRYQRELAKRIFVQNFSESITRQDLQQFFSQYGKVTRINPLKYHKTRKYIRKAFVQFATIDEASSVLSLDSSFLKIDGWSIEVMPAKKRSQRHRRHKKTLKQIQKPNEDIIPEESEDFLYNSEEMNINHLSTELLEHIFSFLGIKERIKIERVCKRWHHIGLHCPWKIRNLKFDSIFSFYNVMTDSILRSILRRCGYSVKKLDMTSCVGHLSYKALGIIADHCPNLESVILSGIPTTNYDVRNFSSKCMKLKVVILDHTLNSGFGEKGLWYLLKNNRDLEVLDVAENYRIKGLCFHLISKNIKRLILNNCSKLLARALLKLERCKYIEELELDRCDSLNTTSLDFIFKHTCDTLKHLSLQGYFPLVHFQRLPFDVLTKLEYLSLGENYGIDDDALKKITLHCHNIHTLNISDTSVTDVGLKALANFQKMKSLNISYMHSVNKDVLTAISALDMLEELKIHGNEYLLDEDFDLLATNCTKLRELDISSCIGLTDEVVDIFQTAFKLRKSEDQTLTIKAGGTMVTHFINKDGFEVMQVNLCPIHKRPFNDEVASFCDSDDYDEEVDCDSDFYYEGDVMCEMESFSDVYDGWDDEINEAFFG